MIRIYTDNYNAQELAMLKNALNQCNESVKEICKLNCDTCNVKLLCTTLDSTLVFLERKLDVTK